MIGDSEDGASRIRCEESRGIGRDNGELEEDRSGRVPPLRMKKGLIRTGGEVDTLPNMDTGVDSARGVQVYVDIGSVETRCVPGDIDRCGVVERLGRSRGPVEPASAASWKWRLSDTHEGKTSHRNTQG